MRRVRQTRSAVAQIIRQLLAMAPNTNPIPAAIILVMVSSFLLTAPPASQRAEVPGLWGSPHLIISPYFILFSLLYNYLAYLYNYLAYFHIGLFIQPLFTL
jgi:hypothetical protein